MLRQALLDYPAVDEWWFGEAPTKKSLGAFSTEWCAWLRQVTGMPRARFHNLRHTFGTNLARAKAGIIVIRDLMGHASVVTTQKYLSAAAEDTKKAVESLGASSESKPPSHSPAAGQSE
jgi:integrase